MLAGIAMVMRQSSTGMNVQGKDKLLLCSIHDVSPRFECEIDQLVALFEQNLGNRRFAMLVVPNHWGDAPILARSPFAAKLRRWSESGIEMFLHGWFHKDEAKHAGASGIKARYMTAGEGEFLGLSRNVATDRMVEGRKLLEDITGRSVAGFIAPAWLYGTGAKEALQQSEFALAEDHFKVWQPSSGGVLARGPVITWASRSKARIASSLAFAAVARLALQPLPNLRIATHPGDTTEPAIMHSVQKTLLAFRKNRRVENYSCLLEQNMRQQLLVPSENR